MEGRIRHADGESPTGREHPEGLTEGPVRIGEMVQYVDETHGVHGPAPQRQSGAVGLDCGNAGVPGDRARPVRKIGAHRAPTPPGSRSRQMTASATDVQEAADRFQRP